MANTFYASLYSFFTFVFHSNRNIGLFFLHEINESITNVTAQASDIFVILSYHLASFMDQLVQAITAGNFAIPGSAYGSDSLFYTYDSEE